MQRLLKIFSFHSFKTLRQAILTGLKMLHTAVVAGDYHVKKINKRIFSLLFFDKWKHEAHKPVFLSIKSQTNLTLCGSNDTSETLQTTNTGAISLPALLHIIIHVYDLEEFFIFSRYLQPGLTSTLDLLRSSTRQGPFSTRCLRK